MISTAATTMLMTAKGCRKLAMTTVLIAVMLCQSIIQCYSFYGGESAYKSMSWSTSSRERAKLGRLDSEPPLLLREWPPETGQETKKEGREAKGSRRIQANRGEEGRRSGSHIKQSKQGGERSRKRKEKERAEFTFYRFFKHYFD